MSYEVLHRRGHAELFIQEHGDSIKGNSKGSKEGLRSAQVGNLSLLLSDKTKKRNQEPK